MLAKLVPTMELALLAVVQVAAEEAEVAEEEAVAPAAAALQPERSNVIPAGACHWEVSVALPAKGGIAR